MRRPASTFICLFLVFLLTVAVYVDRVVAQGTTANINVNAQVSDCVDFTWNMHMLLGDEDPWGGDPDQTVMDFGRLEEYFSPEYPEGRRFTDIWYCVFLFVTADEPYHIKQTSTSLMTQDGQHNLDNSFIVVPDYSSNDKWDGQWPQGPIGGDQLGSASLVKSANILYYGNDGISHIVRVYYSIPEEPKVAVPGWQPIPTSQASGDYEGTVTITIVPQSP